MSKQNKAKKPRDQLPVASSKSRKVILGVLVGCCVVLAASGGYTLYRHDSAAKLQDIRTIDDCNGAQAAVISDVEETISDGLAAIKVYSRTDNLLFQVSVGGGLPSEEIPENFQVKLRNAILGGATPKTINLDAWVDSHTWLGSIGNKETVSSLSSGSLGWAATSLYCDNSSTMLSDEFKLIVGAALDANFTQTELLNYFIASADFGGYSGATAASMAWFNKGLAELNEAQQAYLVYAYSSENPTFEDFKEQYPDAVEGASTPEEFGFQHVGSDPYWLVKEKLSKELETLLGDEVFAGDHYVKLSIDSTLQTKLQQAIDDGLKSSIALDASGLTSVDGTVGVVDPHTGLITALVGGRSINSVSREVSLNCTSLIGNYVAAGKEMEKDTTLTYATLKPIETAEGLTDYAQFGALVSYDQLGAVGISPTVESTSTLDELLEFGTGLYTETAPSLVSEIQDANGNIVYKAETRRVTPNADVLSLLSNTYMGDSAKYVLSCTGGTVQGLFTSEYIVGVLCGTSTSGYTMTYEDSDACATTALNITKLVQDYYPKVLQPIDPNGVVASKVNATYSSNATVIKDAVSSWVEELKTMEINSVGTQQEFEYEYQMHSMQLGSYYGLIPDSLFNELQASLDAVRASRSEELLNFVS